MRVYLPAVASDLTSVDGLAARTAHAVTPALRAASPGESEEDLELPAFLDAAASSLARLRADDVPLRLVVAADVPAASPVAGDVLTEVAAPAVPWSAVVSFHVDDPDDGDTRTTVRAAVAGDDAAADLADDLDLLWYDASERSALLTRLNALREG